MSSLDALAILFPAFIVKGRIILVLTSLLHKFTYDLKIRTDIYCRSVEKIDKQKLLEIARKNAISMLKQGALPVSVISSKDKIASIKAGGKTVDELTGLFL